MRGFDGRSALAALALVAAAAFSTTAAPASAQECVIMDFRDTWARQGNITPTEYRGPYSLSQHEVSAERGIHADITKSDDRSYRFDYRPQAQIPPRIWRDFAEGQINDDPAERIHVTERHISYSTDARHFYFNLFLPE